MEAVLYHFTTLDNLLSILTQNMFVLRDYNHPSNAEEILPYKRYFLCTTRNKRYGEGFTVICKNAKVRISLDADKLKCRYKSSPVNIWKISSRRHPKTILNSFKVEAEERFYNHTNTIPNVKRYIRKIDVLTEGVDEKLMLNLTPLMGDGVNVYFHKSLQTFNEM